jgi:hypothetical protein
MKLKCAGATPDEGAEIATQECKIERNYCRRQTFGAFAAQREGSLRFGAI